MWMHYKETEMPFHFGKFRNLSRFMTIDERRSMYNGVPAKTYSHGKIKGRMREDGRRYLESVRHRQTPQTTRTRIIYTANKYEN
jgi:hypothetical protein